MDNSYNNEDRKSSTCNSLYSGQSSKIILDLDTGTKLYSAVKSAEQCVQPCAPSQPNSVQFSLSQTLYETMDSGIVLTVDESCGTQSERYDGYFVGSDESEVISDQDIKMQKVLENMKRSGQMLPDIFNSENSSNAVDNKLFSTATSVPHVGVSDLSFNGKIQKSCSADELSAPEPKSLSHSVGNEADISLNTSYGMMLTNERSPDLFADDDLNDEHNNTDQDVRVAYDKIDYASESNENAKTDSLLLRRMQKALSGLAPPPGVTLPKLDAAKMLIMYRSGEQKLKGDTSASAAQTFSPLKGAAADSSRPLDTELSADCLLKPSHTTDELNALRWPELCHVQSHGVCYNRSEAIEKFEGLCLRYVDWYVGADTSSSFASSLSPSSSKKRNMRLKLLANSPGNRLSHLAQRRSVFSSETLRQGGAAARPCRQILLGAVTSDHLRAQRVGTPPKRGSPGRRKTPTSSKKKKRVLQWKCEPMVKQSMATRETSKRALFQSPPRIKAVMPVVTPEVAKRVDKSKRALFGRSMSSAEIENQISLDAPKHLRAISMTALGEQSVNYNFAEPVKRKRMDSSDGDGDNVASNIAKIRRLNPIANGDEFCAARFARSQSFCVATERLEPSSLVRTQSDNILTPTQQRQLTEVHKKKILWAVSQSLNNKQIGVKHQLFKTYASVLAQVIKRLFLKFGDSGSPSTSEKLLRWANNIIYFVMQGKSADEIYAFEKNKIENSKKVAKPTGYIGPVEYEIRKNALRQSTSLNATLSQSSIELNKIPSAELSAPSCASSSTAVSIFDKLKQEHNSATKLIGSASVAMLMAKNDENSTVLRENVDSEQRQKSAQKSITFSGKDQKNVSPYTDKGRSSLKKPPKLLIASASKNGNILKAKRQILFDT